MHKCTHTVAILMTEKHFVVCLSYNSYMMLALEIAQLLICMAISCGHVILL
jgi:hypothetical protein